MKKLTKYRVAPGSRVRPDAVDPDDTGSFSGKEEALPKTAELVREIDELQERLYAEGRRSLLIILQAMDTAGKDDVIRHVIRGINPQGCRVTSFKAPTVEEQAHDFLWRVHREVPAKGMIGVFNRSHYEEVLITRVHDLISAKEAKLRLRAINDFERLLVEGGTTILKFHLVISKDEQRLRLQSRVDDPKKWWKFNPNDLTERKSWNRYMEVYAEAVSATSTRHAPWYLIPSNHKWYRNHVVAKVIAATLRDLDPQIPASLQAPEFRNTVIPA